MWLITGLGNPGKEYALNRHNIGFMALNALAGGSGWSKKFQGEIAECFVGVEKTILLKPLTYMNLSGESVGKAANFYKIPPEQVLVIHDDLDIPLGKLRVKRGGGHGGHNGLKSIDLHLGKEYWRLRLGIGHPGDRERVTGHVLGNFDKTEAPVVEDLLAAIIQNLPLLLQQDAPGFLQRCADALPR